MNISETEIKKLESVYSVQYYDKYCNQKSISEATEIYIGSELHPTLYLGIHKTIKAPKKEIDFNYILSKLNAETIYINFAKYFEKILNKKFTKISAYATSYGIGLFLPYKIDIQEIENELLNLNINFSTERSEGGFVYRFKISKSKENIEKINQLTQ